MANLFLLVVLVGFINSLFAIKIAKGLNTELGKLETVSSLVWIFAGIITVLSLLAPSTPSLSIFAVSPNVLILIAGIVLIAVALSAAVLRRKLLISRTFNHLTIHSAKDDDDEPKYVEFRLTKQAYPLIPVLENCSKREKFYKKEHKNEAEIKKYFSRNSIHLNKKLDSLKDLSLSERADGSVVGIEKEIDPNSLSKLKQLKDEGKLDNFRIWFIYPRPYFLLYFFFSNWTSRHYPTRKRLLINYNTNVRKAYAAPPESLALTCGILDQWLVTPWKPWATISQICKTKNITYMADEEHYSIQKLILEAEKNDKSSSYLE